MKPARDLIFRVVEMGQVTVHVATEYKYQTVAEIANALLNYQNITKDDRLQRELIVFEWEGINEILQIKSKEGNYIEEETNLEELAKNYVLPKLPKVKKLDADMYIFVFYEKDFELYKDLIEKCISINEDEDTLTRKAFIIIGSDKDFVSKMPDPIKYEASIGSIVDFIKDTDVFDEEKFNGFTSECKRMNTDSIFWDRSE